MNAGHLVLVCARALLVASAVLAPGGCAPGGPPTIEPPVPLSNVNPGMLNPDGTFKKNGVAPADPSEQI